MSFGLLGTLARESEHTDLGGELTQVEDIAGEAAFDDASEIAREAEMDAAKMIQGLAVADRLEEQADYGTALVESGSVDKSAVALARESMCLAITALGGDPRQSEYVVSRESMDDSPVQAMAVTVEGVGSTAKKIYEGVKLLFKKIANQIKKLAAKLVVAMNRTGKKAEKMLKNFKNQKDKKPKSSKIEDSIRDKILKRAGGIIGYAASDTSDDFYAAYDKMAAGIDSVLDDIITITKKTSELTLDGVTDAVTTGNKDKNRAAKEKIAKELGIDASSIASKGGSDWAKAALDLAASETVKISDGAMAKKMASELSSASGLSDTELANSVMVPIYAKGPNLYFSVTYYKDSTLERVAELEKDNDEAGAAIEATHFAVRNFSLDVVEPSGANDETMSVMSVGDIVDMLGAMKSSSKKLKSFSDKRLKDMDKVMKVVNDAAKKSSGLTIINRLKNNNANKLRTVVASTFISSIFAMASCEKGLLYMAAQHMDMYES